MKKILVSILGIAAMATSACQPKEQAEIATPSGVHEISVTFTADLPGTRTFIEAAEGGWQPKWQKGDAMNVTYKVDGDYTAQKSFVNTIEDGTTGSFSGNLEITDGTHTIYAYYPKDMKDGRAETTFKFALPAGYAKVNGAHELEFSLSAPGRVTIYGPVNGLCFYHIYFSNK